MSLYHSESPELCMKENRIRYMRPTTHNHTKNISVAITKQRLGVEQISRVSADINASSLQLALKRGKRQGTPGVQAKERVNSKMDEIANRAEICLTETFDRECGGSRVAMR